MKINRSYLPIIKTVIFGACFIMIISCSKKQNGYFADNLPTDTTLNNNVTDTGVLTYLALGDSYTIGESVSVSERFPQQLVSLLKQKNINTRDPDIIAVTGWTTGNLLNALNSDPPKNNYSFVTLLIGVNNQFQGRPIDEYKIQFSQLLDKAIAYAGNDTGHVFVLSIPDYSVTPFAAGYDRQKIAKEIDEFNNANKIISGNAGVRYEDITPISREAKNDPSLIATDGLHPSGKQYLKWAELLAPVISDQFGQ